MKILDGGGRVESNGTFHVSASDNVLVDSSTVVAHVERRQRPPRCGWCCFRPNCLQPANRWQVALLVMCWFAFIKGFIVQGITPVNSSSLERRFRLSSTEVGWLSAVLELSAASSTLIFSYLADRAHKPRWLAFSAALFAIGSFLMSLPHYIAEPYNGNGRPGGKTCQAAPLQALQGLQPTGNASFASAAIARNSSVLLSQLDSENHLDCSGFKVSSWLNVLIAGNVVNGVGGGIIFTVGVALIDDFSSSTSSALHLGIMYLCTAAGAAVGFAGGSAMLNQLDVNFNRPDWPQFKGNKDFNPNYVGAWWLGYAIGAAAFGSVAFFFSCFDYEMPETASLRLQKKVETHKVVITIGDDVSGRSKVTGAILKFIGSLLKLITNPVLILVTIAAITHGLLADGLLPFFVKIIRTQFVIREAKAGLAIAIIIVISIGTGTLFSGLFLKKRRLSVRSMILVVTIAIFIATLLGFGFLIHCPQEKITGITASYGQFEYYNPIPTYNSKNLVAMCNARCGCSSFDYQPVCHPRLGLQFFSPCHGGCRIERSVLAQGYNVSVYANCDCLMPLFFQQANLTTPAQQNAFLTVLARAAAMMGAPGAGAGAGGQMPAALMAGLANNNVSRNVSTPAIPPALLAAALAARNGSNNTLPIGNNGTVQLNRTLQAPAGLGPGMGGPNISVAMATAASMEKLLLAYLNFAQANVLVTGGCDTSCPGFYGTMVILFFALFCGYFTLVPLAEIIMRVVPEDDRTFGLAFYQSMMRFLGSIPGPIMIGAIIDRVCLFRDENKCEGDEGSCNSYDSDQLSRWITGVFVGLHIIAVLCYILCFFLYKPANGETFKDYIRNFRNNRGSSSANFNTNSSSAKLEPDNTL